MQPVQTLIQQFQLDPHPEGGWYKETYRSVEDIPAKALPDRFMGDRSFATAIYFLLEQGNFSAFHRIKSDEIWHFYDGDALDIYILNDQAGLQVFQLGNKPQTQQHFQLVVPANCWFASRPSAGSNFSFVGCTVAPGFDFKDFELADVEDLCNRYPNQQPLIRALCR